MSKILNSDQAEEAYSRGLHYYHCMPADKVVFDEIIPSVSHSDDEEMIPAYQWLHQQIGFYPLFMMAGNLYSIYHTGYPNQWMINIGTRRDESGKIVNNNRKRGEFPSHVLFKFSPEKIQYKIHSDYDWWCMALNDFFGKRQPDGQTVRRLFKKSWSESKWHSLARRDGNTVQLLVPRLDLRQADEVWVRNNKTRDRVIAMGFTNVKVRRLPCPDNSHKAIETALKWTD